MPRVSTEEIAKIRQQADIVEIIGDYIPLTQRGKNYFGICPFHQDHSPSMSVSREKQLFKCFSCGAAGNVFKFVSDYENISYYEAVAKVANKIGASFHYLDVAPKKEKFAKEYEIMNLAMLFYQNNLQTEAGKEAITYLKERGLDEEAIKTFDLGLSFTKDQLLKFLNSKNITNTQMQQLGLVNPKNGTYTDVFFNRILFPIHDPLGHVVAFTGRVYQSDGTPKYLNSRETIIFKKGHILFNYHRAKDYIRLEKKVILVEGNMDAIRMDVSGFKNTVALMGTSLTNEQIELIKKLHVPVILMFDNDEAGALATHTNGQLLMDAGVNVQVVRLSNQKDPDEYILHNGVEKMAAVLKQPLSFMEFVYEDLKRGYNLNDSGQLAKYVRNVLNSLAKQDAIMTDLILHKLEDEFHLSYEVLKNEINVKEKDPPLINKEVGPKKRRTRYEISAENILYYMMNDLKYVKMYQAKLGFFKEDVYRRIANEIIYYTSEHNDIVISDFLIYAELSPLKDDIYKILSRIKERDITDTSFNEYVANIKEIKWEEEVKEKKMLLKQTIDVNEKEKIGQKIVELMKKIQEIKKERSVKVND